MGELFKQKILTPNIMLYCIMNLVPKHDEVSLECLCILLKTVGKELEQVNLQFICLIKLIKNYYFNFFFSFLLFYFTIII